MQVGLLGLCNTTSLIQEDTSPALSSRSHPCSSRLTSRDGLDTLIHPDFDAPLRALALSANSMAASCKSDGRHITNSADQRCYCCCCTTLIQEAKPSPAIWNVILGTMGHFWIVTASRLSWAQAETATTTERKASSRQATSLSVADHCLLQQRTEYKRRSDRWAFTGPSHRLLFLPSLDN